MVGSWHVMAHGAAFLQYDAQGGPRGDSQLGSLNWVMGMAGHDLGGGFLQLRTMLSLDRAGVSSRGYPLLLQTGETIGGVPIHDRQHPHDLWMEVAATYEHEIAPNVAFSLYAAPSGEPALGPVAFMHRPSALDLPFAPLSHHWQDATHISFGVLTAGLYGERWKVEGSAFNGREPDEDRWGFDEIRLDSYSGRLTIVPNSSWTLSAGAGHLDSPEAMHADESLWRATASVLHGRAIGSSGSLAWTAAWGMNVHEDLTTHSFLVESDADLDGKNSVIGRAEIVQKTAGELVLPPSSGYTPSTAFRVGALTLGYVRELGSIFGITGGIGAQGTLNALPSVLESAYGSRHPLGGAVFFRVRPRRAQVGTMVM
jgi:hypothetical protein